MKFDATAIFGGPRSKRYALIVEDGKVSKMFAEPDNTGVSGEFRCYIYASSKGRRCGLIRSDCIPTVTSADNILPELK